MGLVCERWPHAPVLHPRRLCSPAADSVPQTERVALAEIQDCLRFHQPLESDAREEKNSYKLKS